MFRALWSASSGMSAQQSNMDAIANNLANVNTSGYKKTSMEFQDLLYANLQQSGRVSGFGTALPVGMQVGVGVRAAAIRTDFTPGNLVQTGNPLDMALATDAFFQIELPNGTVAYTRDGSFKLDSQGRLVTTDGYRLSITGTGGNPLVFRDIKDVTISANGSIIMPQESNVQAEIYVPDAAAKFSESPAGFYKLTAGTLSTWEKGEPPNDVPPKDRYFKVEMPDGSGEAYVKENSFNVDSEGKLVTIGLVAGTDGKMVPATVSAGTLPTLGQDVALVQVNDKGNFVVVQEVGKTELRRFVNPAGLEKQGKNLYLASVASGAALNVDDNKDHIATGFLETSNVQAAEEMVKMIAAQRAYELNSKAITTSDEMLGIANNLRR